MAGNAILLDRVLAHYGAEADDIRDALHSAIAGMVGSNEATINASCPNTKTAIRTISPFDTSSVLSIFFA